ncbi:hypothetical protein SANTM175S_02545 [Streptomyces antimycoticus]
MSAESPGASDRISRLRESFRAWRWQRPFWAGLLSLLAGLPIMYFPYNDVNAGGFTINMSTTAGSASLIIGVLLVVLGLTMWFQPMVRVFAGSRHDPARPGVDPRFELRRLPDGIPARAVRRRYEHLLGTG